MTDFIAKGVINLLKPVGFTSSDAVVSVRKIFSEFCGEKVKTGHFGTLDPAAAGVLPIGVGKAARLFDYYLKKRKRYRVGVRFGAATDTGDSFGKITEAGLKVPQKSEIETAIKNFIGEIRQIPPQYSAINVGGKRAYDLAREGISAKLSERIVNVYKFDLLEFGSASKDCAVFDVECSAGTYIRTLCDDLAKACSSRAYLTFLIRTRSGEFEINNSVTLEELGENPQKYLISLEKVLENMPKIELNCDEFKRFCDGKTLNLSRIAPKNAVFCSDPDDFSDKNDGFCLVYEYKVAAIAHEENDIIKTDIWLWN